MKTLEDEAFDELARKQGAWGGGFKAKRAMAANKLWDKPSVAFDEWWNGDNDESTNPFRLESGAYWAWAGWKAALAQPAQEPRNVRERWNVELDGNDLLVCFNDHEKGDKCQYERYSPQRTWIWLSDADIAEVVDTTCQYSGGYEEYLIKKAERKIRSMNT